MYSILIANRGEIAIRIARTAMEMGFRTIMVAPQDDAQSRHTRAGDTFHMVPGKGPAAYLDKAALIAAAHETGASFVHPGYGFLSESADFAADCEAAGLRFIGPSPDTLSLLGDKSAARQLAVDNGVPVPQGLAGPITLADAKEFLTKSTTGKAMIKAISGGGGRGARPVEHVDDVATLFEICQAEAASAFGDDGLYIEELIEDARHIEIQIVCDTHGNARHLFERECSLQRNRQKVIEIAPSPSISESVRTNLFEASLTMAKACKLRGLATFEFLVRPDGTFVFIEANPRLQVEHTVTESITGLDLVALQIRIEQGQSLIDLGLRNQSALQRRGFAMQLRLCAERYSDTGTLLPSAGRIKNLVWPDGPGVRIDTNVELGFVPNPAYDSLIAKLIVSTEADDFGQLIGRAIRSLKAFEAAGIDTNRELLLALLHDKAVKENAVDTVFLDRHLERLLRERTEYQVSDTRANGANKELADNDGRDELPTGQLGLYAPFSGQLVEHAAPEGESLRNGSTAAVMEAMKMQHDVRVDKDCTLISWRKHPGDVVSEGDLLAVMEPAELEDAIEAESKAIDLDHIRPDLQTLFDRRAKLRDDARPEARDKMHCRGRLTVREVLHEFLDPESFHEIGSLTIAAQRQRRSHDDLVGYSPADGLVAGIGSVNRSAFSAEQAACAVVAYDYSVFAGTQGVYNHKKKDRIFEVIQRTKVPLVLFGGGGGGRPGETDVRLGLDVPTFHTFAKLKGHVPIIAVVAGNCFAGNAALVGCADIIIATKDASIGMGGPAMIEGGGLGTVLPADVGPVSVQTANGLIDCVVEDEREAIELAKQCLSLFQGSVQPGDCLDQRALRHTVPEARAKAFPVRDVLNTMCDTGSVIELKADFGKAMVTAFARIEGKPLGIIANNNGILAGAIDADAAEKASSFLRLCEKRGLPVLSLCDTPGFMVGPEVEKQGQVRKSCDLFATGANLSVPFFCVVLRKAYGLGAQAMASGSFHAPLLSVAWPTAEFGGMGFEGAVQLGYRKELEAISDEGKRQQFFEQKVQELYDENNAITVAEYLEIDQVIDPAETRQWVLHGLTFSAQEAPS